MKTFFLIWQVHIDPMENRIDMAIRKEVVGFVLDKAQAETLVSQAGVHRGTGWPIEDGMTIPRMEFTEVKELPSDKFPFEVLGYYEEFIDLSTEKRTYLGMRKVDKPTVLIGAKGWTEITITEPLELVRGLHEVIVKASPAKPRKLGKMTLLLCGKRRE